MLLPKEVVGLLIKVRNSSGEPASLVRNISARYSTRELRVCRDSAHVASANASPEATDGSRQTREFNPSVPPSRGSRELGRAGRLRDWPSRVRRRYPCRTRPRWHEYVDLRSFANSLSEPAPNAWLDDRLCESKSSRQKSYCDQEEQRPTLT